MTNAELEKAAAALLYESRTLLGAVAEADHDPAAFIPIARYIRIARGVLDGIDKINRNEEQMNRQEAVAAALRELKTAAKQPAAEDAHTQADAALCRLIKAFGYSQVVDAYNDAYNQVFREHNRTDYPPLPPRE